MQTKADLFLELAQPDKDGFSRDVPISEFTGKYGGLRFGNGGHWCRHDSGLANTYNVRRIKEKGRIIAVALHGFNKNPIKRPINSKITKAIRELRCVILDTGNPEVDHKDGRLDDPRLSDVNQQKLDDFQPLSKAANNAKRQHCKNCKDTGMRFDAKKLGYPISQYKGNGVYRGSCIGCYWHDPMAFKGSLHA